MAQRNSKPAKYMAQRQGLFGLEIAYGDTLKGVLKKARISKGDTEFGVFTVRDGGIVRIARNGRLL